MMWVCNASQPANQFAFLGPLRSHLCTQAENHWVDHTEVQWQVMEGKEEGMKSDYKYSWQYSQLFKEIVAHMFTSRLSPLLIAV